MNKDHAFEDALFNGHQHRALSTRLSSIERERLGECACV